MKTLIEIKNEVAISEILDRVLPAQGIGTPREGLRMFAFNQIYTLIDHYRNKSRTEGFNEGIEAALAMIPKSSRSYEMIEKLKK